MMNSSQMAFGPPGGLRLRSLAAFKLDYVRTQAGEREDYFLGHAGVKLCDLVRIEKHARHIMRSHIVISTLLT
jgi:hypothetical protein